MKHWLALMSVNLSDKIGSSNFISHGVQQLKKHLIFVSILCHLIVSKGLTEMQCSINKGSTLSGGEKPCPFV